MCEKGYAQLICDASALCADVSIILRLLAWKCNFHSWVFFNARPVHWEPWWLPQYPLLNLESCTQDVSLSHPSQSHSLTKIDQKDMKSSPQIGQNPKKKTTHSLCNLRGQASAMNALLFPLSCKTPAQKTMSGVGTSFLEFFRAMLKYPPHSPNLINISIPLHKQVQKLTLQNWKSCSLGELAWDASILSYHLWQLGGKDMLGEGKSWENLKFSKVTFKYPPTHINLDPQIESGIIQNCKVCSL